MTTNATVESHYQLTKNAIQHASLCYFAIFIQDPVPNDSNELYIIFFRIRLKKSVVRFIIFQTTKTHLDMGNYYADKLLFSNCLLTAVILSLHYA